MAGVFDQKRLVTRFRRSAMMTTLRPTIFGEVADRSLPHHHLVLSIGFGRPQRKRGRVSDAMGSTPTNRMLLGRCRRGTRSWGRQLQASIRQFSGQAVGIERDRAQAEVSAFDDRLEIRLALTWRACCQHLGKD
jgi:hypothetical protein